MTPGSVGGRPAARDAGFVTVQTLAAVALGLLFVTLMVNLVVLQYGRGVLRTAVDDAARAGARVTASPAAAAAACRATAEAVRDDLLGGALGRGVRFTCRPDGDRFTAAADATFDLWVAGMPPWRFTVRGAAVQETAP